MNKHTPGPWKMVPYETRKGFTIEWQIDGPGWTDLARVHDMEDECGRGFELDGAANARLIAAAPKLLEACEAISQWFEGATGTAKRDADKVIAAVKEARGSGP